MSQALLIVTVVIEALILASLWVVFHQLLQQRGRMLTRLDVVEGRLAAVNQLVGRQAPAQPSGANGQQAAPSQPGGLAVGVPFSPFRLPDLDGNRVGLEDFAGKRVLAVHWNPGCGFCELIASDLAELQPAFLAQNVQMVLLAYGGIEANRKLAEEHRLLCPILLMDDTGGLAAFQNQGTPSAYLLDTQGNVAEPLAVGANNVPALAERVAAPREARDDGHDKPARKALPGKRPLSESKLRRDGLPAGSLAPLFSLPGLDGQTVSLESYRGRKVLLVFSDPNCGPCDAVAPELARIHEAHKGNGLSVVLVGRGGAEENRAKAEKFGFGFPVVLQKRWELSKEYGIFATPVGFLIDEAGVIAQSVGQGAAGIVALVPEPIRN